MFIKEPNHPRDVERPGVSGQGRPTRHELVSTSEESSSGEDSDSEASESPPPAPLRVYLRLMPVPPEDTGSAYELIDGETLRTKIPSSAAGVGSKKEGDWEVWKEFSFTATYGPDTSQSTLFEQVIQPEMVNFMEGQSCTAMAYGSRDSGKSYTIQGTKSSRGLIAKSLKFLFSNVKPHSSPCYKPGLTSGVERLAQLERPREISKIKELLKSCRRETMSAKDVGHVPSETSGARYLIWISFASLLENNIYDLLATLMPLDGPESLKLWGDRHSGVCVKGLTQVCVNSFIEAKNILFVGQRYQQDLTTTLGESSYKFHTIFTITLLKFQQEDDPESVILSR